MKVIIFGGAGYIGGVTAELFIDKGHEVIVADNLSTGHKNYVTSFEFEELDILDKKAVNNLLSRHNPDVVLNFAAMIQVAESMQKPGIYFENNFLGSINIIEAMIHNDIDSFVLSSTAAVYGEPTKIPIEEDDPKHPINPYGLSKYMVEQALASYQSTHSLNWAAFRYFNAAGAYKGKAMDYPVMTHLIPHATEAMYENRPFKLFGDKYDTKDGTCVRDFVHVIDIAQAHVMAAEQMNKGKTLCTALNLGSGAGYTVLEVVKTVEKVSGKKIAYSIETPRPGDPAILIASSDKAKDLLHWVPKYSLEDMVASHLDWRAKKT